MGSTPALPAPPAPGSVEVLEPGPDASKHGVLEAEFLGGDQKLASQVEVSANPGHLSGCGPVRGRPGSRSGIHGACEEVVVGIFRGPTVTGGVSVGGVPPVV